MSGIWSPLARSLERLGARALLLALAVVLVAAPFLLLLDLIEDRSPTLVEVDDGVRDGLHSYALRHPAFVLVMRTASVLGTWPAWTLVFAGVVAWLISRRLPRLAAFVVITVALSSLLNNAVKVLVGRARPAFSQPVAHAPGPSFPSGHAQAAVVGVGVLLLLFLPALGRASRLVAVVFGVLVVLTIGLSRVALGVHYVSDVVGGYVLGLAWLVAMTALFAAWRHEIGGSSVESLPSDGPDDGGRPARPDTAPTAGHRE